MDLFSLGFLLLILIASGGIAYVADGLGKKIGKKRLSLFNLRPKHVAQIGTVAMGVAVSFLTIVVIAAASRDVRDWLIRGRGLLVEQKQLKREVEDLERQRRSEEAKKDAVTTDLREARKDLDGAKNAAYVQAKELKKISAKRDLLLANVAILKMDVAQANDELSKTRLAFQRSTHDLADAKNRLQDTTTRLKGTEAQIVMAKRELNSKQKKLLFAERQYQYVYKADQAVMIKSLATSIKSHELSEQITEYEKQVDTQKERLASLQTESQTLEAQRDKAQQDFDKVQNALVGAQANLDSVQQDFVRLQNFSELTFRSSRTEPLTFRVGEEVARVLVPAGASPETARGALDTLLREAQADAESRGAKGHRSKRAADIIDRTDPKTGAVTDADALKRAVVAQIAGRPDDQALVATSSFNAFAGETVSLEIAVVPNPVVYHRNEMLAEARIDGSLSEEGILAQLRQLLGDRVRDRAVQDRMIPRSGAPSPFGEVPTASWFSLAQDVKRAGRPVRVQAFAGDETRAADPLRLEFRVK